MAAPAPAPPDASNSLAPLVSKSPPTPVAVNENVVTSETVTVLDTSVSSIVPVSRLPLLKATTSPFLNPWAVAVTTTGTVACLETSVTMMPAVLDSFNFVGVAGSIST